MKINSIITMPSVVYRGTPMIQECLIIGDLLIYSLTFSVWRMSSEELNIKRLPWGIMKINQLKIKDTYLYNLATGSTRKVIVIMYDVITIEINALSLFVGEWDKVTIRRYNERTN